MNIKYLQVLILFCKVYICTQLRSTYRFYITSGLHVLAHTTTAYRYITLIKLSLHILTLYKYIFLYVLYKILIYIETFLWQAQDCNVFIENLQKKLYCLKAPFVLLNKIISSIWKLHIDIDVIFE